MTTADTGSAILQETERFKRIPMTSGTAVPSGTLVEVELEIDSKNDYEYLVFEDLRPAGFEPVAVQSGYDGNQLGAYVEYRDAQTNFFVRHLPRGRRSVSYRVRAEVPGVFSALPTMGYAMYAPELKANSNEWKVRIADPGAEALGPAQSGPTSP